jgi:alcohol dehydrogenase class IV
VQRRLWWGACLGPGQATWLPVLMKDLGNLEARTKLMLASHMAGVAFSIAGLGICHAVGHPLSALLGKVRRGQIHHCARPV